MLEDGVVLSEGNVGYLIRDSVLRLLFGLREAVSRSSDVPLVDVLYIFGVGVVHGIHLGLLSLSVDFVKNNVKLMSIFLDMFLQNLANAWSESSEKDGLGQSKEDLMLRFLHLDVDVLNVDVHLGNLEKVLAISRSSSFSSNLEAKALTTHEDIADTSVLNGREALLALHVESDITKVHLDTRDSQHDLVLVLVGNLFPTPAPIIVCAEFENVGSEVVAFDHEIFDHDVDSMIRVLETGERHVPNIDQALRNDDLGQVLDKMRLESWLAEFIIAKVMEQMLHSVTESLVLWISIKLVADKLDFVKDAVGVSTVFVTEEIVALVIKRVPTEGQSSLQNL
jgi:hypothetical protein